MKKRVVLTGGGTGGHLYPALAVAEALQENPDVEALLYIGNRGKREAELIPEHGIAFEGLVFSGMPRRLNLSLLGWVRDLLTSFLEARRSLQRFRPHVAFGTGGYVTAPVLFAALSLGVPYVVHEPDAHPGLVNRLMGRWASAMTCAFAGARQRLKTQTLHVTGNPLRSQMGQVDKASALRNLNIPFSLDKPVLFVTGGSQGARRLNQAVLEALPVLVEELGFQVIHQTGDKLFQEVVEACPEAYRSHPAYRVNPFIQDMASTLALGDIAVCRSGSMTLSEMYRAHIPTILVPYPFAAADHQRKNALASQEAGASVMVGDAQFTGEALIQTLRSLQSDPARLEAMKQAAASLSSPGATAQVVTILLQVAREDLP